MSVLKYSDSMLKAFLKKLYYKKLEKELRGSKTVLDVGCGDSSVLERIPKKFRATGVDVHAPSIEASKRKGTHDEYILASLETVAFPPKSYDAVIAIEIVEYLEKTDSIRLVKNMESWARKKVVITTPNGFFKNAGQGHWSDEQQVHLMLHKCGWTVDEFLAAGYRVRGLEGLKGAHGQTGDYEFLPAALIAYPVFFPSTGVPAFGREGNFPMMAELKRNIRSWLSGHPWLLEVVFRALGKPYTEIEIFRSLIHGGDTILDLGANTGQYTCLFCILAGSTGAVHAFEPIPPTFEMLKRNVARHAKKCPVFLNNLAAGDSEGAVTMFVSDGRFTEASMVNHAKNSPAANFDCRVTTIDRYMKEKNITKVDMIKCDVEGAELLAMKGAKALLKSKNPPVLFLEAWSGWTKDFGYRPADLFTFLEREAGYAIYHVYKGGMRRVSAGEKLPPDSFPDFLNFLCVVPAVHGDRMQSLKYAGIDIIENK